MLPCSGLVTFALAVSLAELPERLPSADADIAAADCVDDAWAEMELSPAVGFVSALGTPLELQATFPACSDMVWVSIEIRYLGKTTKRVQHGERVLTVECELRSGEQCRGRKSGMVEVRVSL
jgi:hypothetical protein